MAKKVTITQFADGLKKMSKDLNKAVATPFRVNLKIMQRALASEYWDSSFGKRIWDWQRNVKGDMKGAPSVKLGSPRRRRYARWSQSEQAFVGTIWVLGLAAKIEEGGRLRKHKMWGRAEREPGVMVPRRPVMDRVLDKLWAKAVDDISVEFGKFVERTL